jgi:hypothetical protein
MANTATADEPSPAVGDFFVNVLSLSAHSKISVSKSVRHRSERKMHASPSETGSNEVDVRSVHADSEI